ncbi:MAG: helix-turn-helix transcriptional regulator [Ruminococcaceae bacterium]|nr:helix-turn-helix transcriptional regulator [Oscillospiraceae bacterium]
MKMSFATQPIKKEIEIKGFNSIYYFEFCKDFSHPPERHNFWELVYVDSGEINAVTDGIGRTLSQGQVIFHKPMELHAHISNKIVPNSMLVVSFTSDSEAMEFFDKKIFTLGKTPKTLLSLFINEAKEALGDIPNEYSDKRSLDFSTSPFGSLQLLECYLTEFLLTLKRSDGDAISKATRTEDSRTLAHSSIVELIIDYLNDGVCGNITLTDICSNFYMGKTQLCALFKEHCGEGPIEYYTKLKTAKAKKLLLEGMSVSKISDMLGYSSIHNFSRAFKKNVGVSPIEYKKKILAQ